MISVIKSNDGLKLRRVAPSAAMLQLDRNASGYHGERGDDASNSLFEITQHQFRRQMQHAIPEPPKQAVPPRVSGNAAGMRHTIHFNNQLESRCKKVYDKPINYYLYAIHNFAGWWFSLNQRLMLGSLLWGQY